MSTINAQVRQRTTEIQRLEGLERAALYLHELSGYTEPEIAVQLRVPLPHVFDLIASARQRLATDKE